MSTTTNNIHERIAENGWTAETAAEVLLDYFKQAGLADWALEALIAQAMLRGKGEQLLAFIEDHAARS